MGDGQRLKIELLSKNGYTKSIASRCGYSCDKPFPNAKLPDGFSVISLEDENDFEKIHVCLWKGFNHGDNPDDD